MQSNGLVMIEKYPNHVMAPGVFASRRVFVREPAEISATDATRGRCADPAGTRIPGSTNTQNARFYENDEIQDIENFERAVRSLQKLTSFASGVMKKCMYKWRM
jgi:hypothetical protein